MLLALSMSVLAPPVLLSRADLDITPPEPLPLGGYTERGGRVAEPGGRLFARAVVLSRRGFRLALLAVDCLTIPESLYREVRRRLPGDLVLFLAATHTHSAPDSQMLNDRMTFAVPGIASFKARWLEWYSTRLSAAVKQALANPPATVDAAEAAQIHMEANRGRRLGAAPDRMLTMLFATSNKGSRGSCVLAHFTAHPIVYGPENMTYQPDWPGVLAEMCRAPVLNGAIGDVSPLAEGETAADRMMDFRRRISNFDREFRTERVWTSPGILDAVAVRVPLGAKAPHPDFASRYRIPQNLAESLVRQFAPDAVSIHAFRLGKLAVVGVPGEPTSHIGRRIRDEGRRLGFSVVLVVSNVNGWMGYLLDSADYDRGGYEPTLSFYGREQGNRTVAAAINALRDLAATRTGSTRGRPRP